MAVRHPAPPDSLRSYREKRNFAVTREPDTRPAPSPSAAPIFVVQKHAARRAGLHWDFRLEHDGVLWSWAVPKGPSMDPADKRMAIHVEDHPLDYATFQGTIPEGEYGAGDVETWDHGTWTAVDDPDAGMRKGHLKFSLAGSRLSGPFSLVKLRRRGPGKPEAWLLIKGHDEPAVAPERSRPAKAATARHRPPAQGAVRAEMPTKPVPQLCATADEPPEEDEWVCEVKFDGYRILAAVDGGRVRLLTRNGHDWTDRLPALARAVAKLDTAGAVIDGELVAQGEDGLTSFPSLQAALKAGQDATLIYYAFDLLFLDGWDLRGCTLLDRKTLLTGLITGTGMLRISEHHQGRAREMAQQACRMHLEGLVFKRAAATYRGGRGHNWVKVKCHGREELIVLGWTPPAGSRRGVGALHLGYYDRQHQLHYAGAVGSGFSDTDLVDLRQRLDQIKADAPRKLLVAGDTIDPSVTWVQPEIVVEVRFTDWSGAGRIRHGVYLGERADKTAAEVVRDVADPEAERAAFTPSRAKGVVVKTSRTGHAAVPPRAPEAASRGPTPSARIVVAQAPKSRSTEVAGVRLSHPDRQLWPGITKHDLALYWQTVAEAALPGLANRPLAILRCPDGIEGREKFFQKNGHGIMPDAIREGLAVKQPYFAIDDVTGLVAMAQMSAIELHPWGATEANPTHPDRLVFDLDPGEGVAFSEVVLAAHDVRERLKRLGLVSFCRTSGGKGLHVVAPIVPKATWETVKPFCRAFAEAMEQDRPDRYVAHVKIADRRGRILVDWLRNGLGATAIASFCPRARPGAPVATPLAWREVTERLDPSAHTLLSVPARLARLKADPWKGFETAAQSLPTLKAAPPPKENSPRPSRTADNIVVAKPPARRR